MSEDKKPKLQPPQSQDRQPGIESEMTPRPQSSMENWRAAGKLMGKTALVTGGDSGIGRAVAIGFAKEGADVVIVYKDEHNDASETKALVEATGRNCHLIAGDVGDPAFAKDAVAKAAAFLGRIDILVNNAAEQHENDDFATIEEAQVERTFRTNIFGYFWMAKYALAHMPEGGAIINTTSITAYRGSPQLVDYASTKGAIVAFTRSLAGQLYKSRKIRVNAVAPGPIWTPLIPASFDAERTAAHGANSQMGRAGQPDEVAPSYIFLASEADSSYISGQVLHPNGGDVVNG
ncbi:SDR family oxidoreductase [Muricoccus radiodurans]|uniref:SDR family oxidoreductase n=1 Tax=Muricoccus radiodurans TaxID=2231721 RepID=UPI003CFA851C